MFVVGFAALDDGIPVVIEFGYLLLDFVLAAKQHALRAYDASASPLCKLSPGKRLSSPISSSEVSGLASRGGRARRRQV